MIWPPLTKVEWEHFPRLLKSRTFSVLPCLLHAVLLMLGYPLGNIWKHLFISFVLNWIVAPLIMLALAWATLPEDGLSRERKGVLLVGVGKFVVFWSPCPQLIHVPQLGVSVRLHDTSPIGGCPY